MPFLDDVDSREVLQEWATPLDHHRLFFILLGAHRR